MLRTISTGLLPRMLQKGLGARRLGAVETTLLSTGAALVARRERRNLGLLLLAAGGMLVWAATANEGHERESGGE